MYRNFYWIRLESQETVMSFLSLVTGTWNVLQMLWKRLWREKGNEQQNERGRKKKVIRTYPEMPGVTKRPGVHSSNPLKREEHRKRERKSELTRCRFGL